MGAPTGFTLSVRGSEVLIDHAGRHATTLRGPTARRFLADVERDDPQELMARVTGSYRRGNERVAVPPHLPDRRRDHDSPAPGTSGGGPEPGTTAIAAGSGRSRSRSPGTGRTDETDK